MERVTKVAALPNYRLQVSFADGYVAEVNLREHVAKAKGPVVQPLKKEAYFQRVRITNDSIAWPNGYDVCPDVLRFWCEQGRATTQAETGAHFAALAR